MRSHQVVKYVRLGNQSTEARLVRAEDFRDPHTGGARKSGTHMRAEVLAQTRQHLAAEQLHYLVEQGRGQAAEIWHQIMEP
jgi:hypothetical protein